MSWLRSSLHVKSGHPPTVNPVLILLREARCWNADGDYRNAAARMLHPQDQEPCLALAIAELQKANSFLVEKVASVVTLRSRHGPANGTTPRAPCCGLTVAVMRFDVELMG